MSYLDVYEYDLKGYSESGDEEQNFPSFKVSENEDECPNIETILADVPSPNTLSSCDLLNNNKDYMSTDSELFQQFINIYLHNPTKISDPKNIKSTVYSYKTWNELLDLCIAKVEGYVECAKTINDASITKSINQNGYVLRLPVDVKEQVVVLGDFHGSFHSFFRIMFRLHFAGIIDLNTLKVTPNFRIVFLGDIVDRGNYGMEILYIILHIIKNNDNGKVILNRGNHEDPMLNMRDGFFKEVGAKLKNNYFKEEQIQYIYVKMNTYFLKCSVAVVIECEKKRYWLAHGGIPRISFLNWDNKSNYICLRSQLQIMDILWTDFSKDATCTSGYKKNNSRGGDCILVEPTYLLEFMIRNDISFIIRGHQDFYSNSFLFSSEHFGVGNRKVEGTDFKSKQGGTVVGDVYAINNKVSPLNRVKGPIGRIHVDSNSFHKNIDGVTYYPVVTLSTATDYLRNLKKDSFAILRFDNPKFDFSNYSINVKSYRLKNNTLLKSSQLPSKLKKGLKLLTDIDVIKSFLVEDIQSLEFSDEMLKHITVSILKKEPIDSNEFKDYMKDNVDALKKEQIIEIYNYIVDNI
jgi:hypothetical protein